MENILAKLENMPLTYTVGEGWELFDELTGEIFPVATERGGVMLRNMALRTNSDVYRFARVRNDLRNTWDDTYGCDDNRCKCCDMPLHKIDPENICMECVDIGCNVKDEN